MERVAKRTGMCVGDQHDPHCVDPFFGGAPIWVTEVHFIQYLADTDVLHGVSQTKAATISRPSRRDP
jgi:hypothetical protein